MHLLLPTHHRMHVRRWLLLRHTALHHRRVSPFILLSLRFLPLHFYFRPDTLRKTWSLLLHTLREIWSLMLLSLRVIWSLMLHSMDWLLLLLHCQLEFRS
jgi:hypothetical protein